MNCGGVFRLKVHCYEAAKSVAESWMEDVSEDLWWSYRYVDNCECNRGIVNDEYELYVAR